MDSPGYQSQTSRVQEGAFFCSLLLPGLNHVFSMESIVVFWVFSLAHKLLSCSSGGVGSASSIAHWLKVGGSHGNGAGTKREGGCWAGKTYQYDNISGSLHHSPHVGLRENACKRSCRKSIVCEDTRLVFSFDGALSYPQIPLTFG